MSQSEVQNNIIDVWLDCDPGFDDVFAIILAASHPRLNLLGVSTTSGNTTIKNTTQNALNVLSMLGKDNIPVYMGSQNPSIKGTKLGYDKHGEGIGGIQLIASKVAAFLENPFELMLEKIMGNKNKVVFICTGSLTNLALLLKIAPHFKQNIQYVSLMGGAIGAGNMTAAAQFNIYYDPLSAQTVLQSSIPIVMIPLQVTHTALCQQSVVQRMKQRKSKLSKVLIEIITKFKQIYFIQNQFPHPPLHDPCAVFYVIEPHQFTTKKARVDIDLFPSSSGRTNCNFKSSIPNATVCLKMNVPRFWQVMMDGYCRIVPQQ